MTRPAPLFAAIAAIAAALTVVGAAPVTSGPSRGRRVGAAPAVCTVDGVLDAKDPFWGPIWGNTCATLTDGSAGWNSPGQGFHLGNGEVLDIRFSGRKEVSSIAIETGLGAAESNYMPRSFKVEYITEGGQLKLAQEYGPGLATAGTSSYRIVLAGDKIGVAGLRITNTGGSNADQWLRLAQVSVASPPPPPPPPALIIGPYGYTQSAATCPSGYTSLTSADECRAASAALGLPFDGTYLRYSQHTRNVIPCARGEDWNGDVRTSWKWAAAGHQICKLIPPKRDCGFLGYKCNPAVVLGTLGWRLGSNAANHVAGWF